MQNENFSFYNYSTSDITVISPNGDDAIIIPGSVFIDKSSSGDYTIEYNSKKFKMTRDDINKLTVHSYYDIFITDNITLGDPVSQSTYTREGDVNKISDFSGNTWSVFVSPDQKIIITNGSPDQSWVKFESSSGGNMMMIIIFIIIFLIICVVVGVSGYYYWKKRHE